MKIKFKKTDMKHWDEEYRDGGSINSDRTFTEWDFNKLMASDKFRAVWNGNLWEIIEEGRTTVLGKFNPKTKSLYISGDKNMNNFLVVWMTENGFVNSDEYAILANGGGVGNDWFWNHAYRHYMRDASLEQRNKVKKQFIKEGLDLEGESPRHSAIISSIVGEYANGGGVGSENFYALTSDGMRNKKRAKILKVQYWKGRETNHAPTLENIKEFLLQVPFDEKIVIYADEDYIDDSTSFYGQLHSAYTPLYTAGAITVDAIVDENNNMIWNFYAKGKHIINVDDYKFKNGGGVSSNYKKFGKENPRLVNFNIDDLDYFESMQYEDFIKSMDKASALQILINNVEGDYSQLSEKLAEIAEEQYPSDEYDNYANGGAIKTDFNELENTELRNLLISFWNDFFNNNIGNYLSIEKENYILSNIDNVFVIVRDEDKGNFSNVEKQNIDSFLSPYFESDKKPLFTDFFNNYEIKDNKIIIYIKAEKMYANGGGVDSYPFNLTILVSNKDYAKIVIQKHNGVILNESQKDKVYEFTLGSYDWKVLDKIADELYDKGFMISQYANGGGVKGKKGDIGKQTGKQYGYTLSEVEKAWKNILVSPTDYWKKEEGSVYTDSFGRRQVVRESSKMSIMNGYAYRIMILLDLGSNKVPASAKKYAMTIYEFAPNEISVKLYKNGGMAERIDLFEDYENIPTNIQEILDEYSEDFEDGNYEGLANALQEVEAEGYTFEYYLDGQAYGLRPIDVPLNQLKGYEDMGEEYANGGGVGKDYTFNYMMLSRLKSDCEYFLGWGNRSERNLWADNVDAHIKEMKRLWNSFPKDAKPEWLSMDDILEYERKMKGKYAEGGGVGNYEIYHDTLASCLREVENYAQKKGYNIGTYFPTINHVSYGTTHRTTVDLLKDGKIVNTLNIQIYRMDSGRYELNMYSSNKMANGGGIETTDYSDLAFASKTFSKTSEMLVRENLNNGEICMCKLTKILGHEPNYPIQIVGSLKLEKCFMKRFYKIV